MFEIDPLCAPCLNAVMPVVNFTASERRICPGTCIDFTNLSIGATSYQWFFPGAVPDTSSDMNPTFICYNTPGNYDVTLIATNAFGTDTVTLINLIQVYPQPVTPVITQVGNILFSSTGYVTYQWFYGSDSISGATNDSYYGQLNGNYNLVVTDSNGCAVGVGILNVVFEPDGVKEFGVWGLGFEVYPNPAKDNFTLTMVNPPKDGFAWANGQSSVVNLEIYNSLGEKVYPPKDGFDWANNIITKEKEVVINTAYFGGGIYLLKITAGGNILTKKIVIEK
jgi:PKD repeat protein